MKSKIIHSWMAGTASLVFVVSCNIYSPFGGPGTSDADLVEAGQKCLHENDYGCALEKYNLISDSGLKAKKLCMAYLGRGGFTLTALLNTVTKNDDSMLGTLAQELVPWSSSKQADVEAARTQCEAFENTANSGDTGVLLASLGHLVDCASRMAKTETTVCTGGNDAAPVSGDGNGTINSGQIDGGANTMCDADVVECQTDMNNIDPAALGNAGLGDIQTAINTSPVFQNKAAGTAALRGFIATTVPAR